MATMAVFQIGGEGYDCYGRTSYHYSSECYNPASSTWVPLKNMSCGRSTSAVEVLNGKLYVIGGYSDDGIPKNSAECYDPIANKWTSISPMKLKRSNAGMS